MGGSKKVDTSRRSFLRRSALLVSALGVGSSVQTGLLDAIGRKARRTWGTALAADGRVMRVIDIAGRAGFDSRSLVGCLNVKQNDVGARLGNTNFRWSSSAVGQFNTGYQNPLFLVNVDGTGNPANIGQPNPLGADFAEYIAVMWQDPDRVSHQSIWGLRGKANGVVPAKANMMKNPGAAAVEGILWNTNSNVNNPGPGSLTGVNSNPDFINLYRDVPMYFTRDELRLLVGNFKDNSAELNTGGEGALQKLDSLWESARPLPGQQDVFQVGHNGRAGTLFTVDLDPFTTKTTPFVPDEINASGRDLNQLLGDFVYEDGNYDLGGVEWGSAMFHLYRAFAHPAMLALSSVIQFNAGDWHGDTNGMDVLNNKQGQWATVLTQSLHAFIKHASNTPDPLPANAGTSIWDNTIITLSSEFGRGPRLSSDNGDRGPQCQIMMGGMIKGGTYGDWDMVSGDGAGNGFGGYGDGRIFGVNGQGVATAGAPLLPELDGYATNLRFQGWSNSEIGGMMNAGTAFEPMIRDEYL